jgi:D-glycero-D-manno-heptose 1,7-bisphosphate phosphatase
VTELRRAVFLDRDGTLIEEAHYLSDPAAVRLLPGAAEALARLREAGYALVLVTNQSGIARGLYTEEEYHRVAARLGGLLREAGVPLDAAYYCPHHPEHGAPCACRKPSTGMYEAAAAELGLDPAASWYVGDKESDILPAATLGGQGVLVRTGHGRDEERRAPRGVVVVDDLGEAADLIVGAGRAPVDLENRLG